MPQTSHPGKSAAGEACTVGRPSSTTTDLKSSAHTGGQVNKTPRSGGVELKRGLVKSPLSQIM